MLMTPMTPNVIASPIAASTSTEPWLRPNSSVCMHRVQPALPVDGPQRRLAAACRTRASGFPVAAIAGALHHRRKPVVDVGIETVRQGLDCRQPVIGLAAVEVRQCQAGADLALDRRRCSPGPVGRAAARSSSVIDRAQHFAHRIQPHACIGIGQIELRHRDAQRLAQLIVDADARQRIARRLSRGRAGQRVRQRQRVRRHLAGNEHLAIAHCARTDGHPAAPRTPRARAHHAAAAAGGSVPACGVVGRRQRSQQLGRSSPVGYSPTPRTPIDSSAQSHSANIEQRTS